MKVLHLNLIFISNLLLEVLICNAHLQEDNVQLTQSYLKIESPFNVACSPLIRNLCMVQTSDELLQAILLS